MVVLGMVALGMVILGLVVLGMVQVPQEMLQKISFCSGWMRQLLALLVASALLDAPATQVVKNVTTEQKSKRMII
jgi:hypothetical protein